MDALDILNRIADLMQKQVDSQTEKAKSGFTESLGIDKDMYDKVKGLVDQFEDSKDAIEGYKAQIKKCDEQINKFDKSISELQDNLKKAKRQQDKDKIQKKIDEKRNDKQDAEARRKKLKENLNAEELLRNRAERQFKRRTGKDIKQGITASSNLRKAMQDAKGGKAASAISSFKGLKMNPWMMLAEQAIKAVEWIEYYMSIIPYTYEVLKRLMNDGNEYKLIIGADNLREIHSWYKIADLLQTIDIMVIPRDNIDCISELDEIYKEYPNVKNISILDDCPYCTLSSTFVREQIKEGKDISFYVPEDVRKYIKTQMMYADTLICSWDDYKGRLWINFENSCYNKDLVDKLVKYLKDYTSFDDADIDGCSVEMGDEDISWSDIGYTKERFEEICNKIGLRVSWV